MNIAHAEREHARYSPSSLESREQCPGWENKDGEETVWASDGERCHEAVQGLIENDETKFKALTTDLQSFAQECYDYAAPRIAGSERIICEQRLYHADPTLRENSHGSPDLIAITGRDAILIDFKFGRRPVTNANENLQGWTYALGLWDTYPEVETITICFVVPRVHRGTSDATFTRSGDYRRFHSRISRAVNRALVHADADLVPCWSSCAYCGVKANCQALRTYLESFMNDTTKGTLGDRLNAAKLAKDWAEQVEGDILDKALEGAEVEGFEVRIANGKSSAKSLAVVHKALGDKISLDKLTEVATVPLTQLKQLYAAETGAGTKSESDKEVMKLLIAGDALKTGNEAPYLYRLNEKL